MNAKISVFVICAEANIYLLWYNLQDYTFNSFDQNSVIRVRSTLHCIK